MGNCGRKLSLRQFRDEKVTNRVVSALLASMISLIASHAFSVQADPSDCQQTGSDDATLVVNKPTAQTQYPDLSFQEQFELNGDRAGAFIYKAFDNPDKVRNQLAGSAILYGLDYMGFGGVVREGIYFIKQNTRFTFGDCGNVQLRTNRVTAGTCITGTSSLEFNSSYDFNSIQLQLNWSM